jgi:hypothetical protein
VERKGEIVEKSQSMAEKGGQKKKQKTVTENKGPKSSSKTKLTRFQVAQLQVKDVTTFANKATVLDVAQFGALGVKGHEDFLQGLVHLMEFATPGECKLLGAELWKAMGDPSTQNLVETWQHHVHDPAHRCYKRALIFAAGQLDTLEAAGMWMNKTENTVVTADGTRNKSEAFVELTRKQGILDNLNFPTIVLLGERARQKLLIPAQYECFYNINEHHANLPLHTDSLGVLPGHAASDATPGPGDGLGDVFVSLCASYRVDGRAKARVVIVDVENLTFTKEDIAVPVVRSEARTFVVEEGALWGCLEQPAGHGARHRAAHGVSVSDTVHSSTARVDRRCSVTFRFRRPGGPTLQQLQAHWDTFTG